jgi:hypothetical protein
VFLGFRNIVARKAGGRGALIRRTALKKRQRNLLPSDATRGSEGTTRHEAACVAFVLVSGTLSPDDGEPLPKREVLRDEVCPGRKAGSAERAGHGREESKHDRRIAVVAETDSGESVPRVGRLREEVHARCREFFGGGVVHKRTGRAVESHLAIVELTITVFAHGGTARPT